MSDDCRNSQHIAIYGAGIIGLSCAWEFLRRGHRVSLFDKRSPGRGASWAAAGMLAPAYEAGGTDGIHPKLFDLCLESAGLWPAWANDLQAASGLSSGFSDKPSLAVGLNQHDCDELGAIEQGLIERELPVRRLTRSQLRALEHSLVEDIVDGLELPTDKQVDNRLTLAALRTACGRYDAFTLSNGVSYSEGHAKALRADSVLLCAGWETGNIQVDIPCDLSIIRPYGGQMLSVRPWEGAPIRTIRCGDIYIAPKAGRIIIGATTEPERVLTEPIEAQIEELRMRASAIVPTLKTAPILEKWAGTRPGAPGHAPIMGRLGSSKLYVASGHYRNGILLAPLTARLMAELICEGRVPKVISEFAPPERASSEV